MPPSKYSRSPKFAALPRYEKAARIGQIKDKGKRAKAQEFWGLNDSPDSDLLHAAGKALTLPKNIVGDVPQLAKSMYESGQLLGTATYHDIRAGRGLTKPGGLLYGKSETGDIAKQMITSIPAQAKLLADPKAWMEDPLIQSLNAASFVLPAARAGSVGMLARSLRLANPELSVLKANRLAVAESFHPGFARAQGFKGGIAPRLTKARYGPEEGTRGRMPSRQPVIRAAQRAIDAQAERLDVTNPASRWSASSRAQRMKARQAAADVRREKATRVHQEKEIVSGLLGKGKGATVRQFLDRPGKTDRPRAAAMVAALESPVGMGVRESVETKINALNDVLTENTEHLPRQEEIDQLRTQRDALPEGDEGRAALDTEIGTKQAALDFDLGRDVPAVTGSPMRDLVHKTMVKTIGKERANQAIKVWDARARAAAPEDPASWYTANIAGAQHVPLAEFAPENGALYQRMASQQGGWYFPIQHALEELGDRTMQVGQLNAVLKKAGISTEELRNSGMTEVAERSPDLVVTPNQVLGELHAGGYFQTFDPDVTITRRDPSSQYETQYDPDAAPQLNSRDAAPGEYHEMVVRYPELPGTQTGESHWHKPGVAYHVRYQIFHDEDNNRVMLIDEIQSDWASDVRRGVKQGKAIAPSPMGQNRYLNNAVRQILREADSQDVDHVVLVDGDTQALRNNATDLGVDDGVTVDDGFDNGTFGEWVDDETGEPLTNEQITAKLRAQGLEGNFTRLYNKEIPKVFSKVGGAEARYLDDAYTGRHGAQAARDDFTGYQGYVQTADSGMPGTVFEMTPEVKAKIREDQPLYRRNFKGVAQGATEFLADGRARVTMFEKADVSTWVHELAHVALPDLDPADLSVLERELADGRSLDKWTEADHESYARAFETYLRDGHAAPALREVFAKITKWMKDVWRRTGAEAEKLHPEVADTFDRMLGKRYNNTVVLRNEDIARVEADIKDLRDALDSNDLDKMESAVNALAELSHQSEAIGLKILTDGKTPDQAEAIAAGLANRKNAVVEDYRRRGLVGYDEEAKGYFPHFSMWDSVNPPPADAVRMAATGDVIGTPQIPGKTINRRRNKLIRYQTGEVLNDPVVVTYILRARLRLQETIAARRELYEVGDPIDRSRPIDKDMVYVRNPDVTPEKMHLATQAANRLGEVDFRELSARQRADEIDEINDVDGMADEMFYDPSKDKRPHWVDNEDNVRVVPGRIARNRLGDVFRSAPRGKAMAALGITNALFRIASIYARPWRYIPINYAQNAVMLAMTSPRAFTNLVRRDVARITKEDPQLRNMIREEVGTIQATALPEFNIRPQNRMQGTERWLTEASGQMGEVLGRYADVPIREAAWLNHAGKYGFTTAGDLRRLIEDPDLAEVRDIVSQRTKEDLIDFDTLNPYEKEVMTRYLALWPFIRGITKWPFMYAREYPARVVGASLASGAVNQPETNETVQDMGILKMFGKGINLGKLDPSAPGREAVQNAVALARGASQVAQGKQPDLTAIGGNYLTPGLREVLGMATGEGRKGWVKSMGRTFIPGVGPFWVDPKKGGSIADQALRQMGLIRDRTDGVRDEVKTWMSPADKVAKQMRERGQVPPPVLAQIQKLRAPYGDWKQYESETKFAHRDRGESDKLTEVERMTGLLDIAKEHFPQVYAQADNYAKSTGWASFEQLLESGKADEEWLAKVDRYTYDQMFGAMEDMKRQAKQAGYDVE